MRTIYIETKEVKAFIDLAESNISQKEGIDKEKQESFVRGLKIMYSMIVNHYY